MLQCNWKRNWIRYLTAQNKGYR